MDMSRLELLASFADHGSIASVAKAVFRTPSAVSQQLKLLEREAGTTLLEPYGRGLRLTEAGQILVDGARNAERELERATTRLEEFRGVLRGTVRIMTFTTAGQLLLPGVLQRLHRTAPDVDLSCRDEDLDAEAAVEALLDFHIVLAYGPQHDWPWQGKHVNIIPLFTEPIDVVLPSEHPLAAQDLVTPQDLVGERWIGTQTGYAFDHILQQLSELTHGSMVQRHEIDDPRLAEALVAAGQGITLLPRFTTAVDKGYNFVLKPLIGVDATREVVALVRDDHIDRRSVQAVLGALKAEATYVVQHRHPMPTPTSTIDMQGAG